MLDSIPLFETWKDAEPWVNEGLKAIASASFDQDMRDSFTCVTLNQSSSPTDLERFALALLLADWACYPKSADRMEFPRAFNIVRSFPQGLHLWFCRLKDGSWLPVGYAGWYPIPEEIFNHLYNTPEKLTHRGMITPLSALNEKSNYLYILNYSIIPPLYKTLQSRMLMQKLAESLSTLPSLDGIGTVTVSEHGIRIAKRFGLSYRGDMTHDGDVEGVHAARAEDIKLRPTQKPEQT